SGRSRFRIASSTDFACPFADPALHCNHLHPFSGDSPMTAPHSRRRWFWMIAGPALGILLLLLAIVILGWIVERRSAARLQGTVAELDRTDLAWRIEAVEANRAAVEDADNGAFISMKAASLMPRFWPEATELLNDPMSLEPGA